MSNGPWWGLRCCCEGSSLECVCPLHFWADGDQFSRCDPLPVVVMEPLDLDAINSGVGGYPCIDSVGMEQWGGTYVFTCLATNYCTAIGAFDPEQPDLVSSCNWLWASAIWAADYRMFIRLNSLGDVAAQLLFSVPGLAHALYFGRNVFAPPWPWNLLAAGEIRLPFLRAELLHSQYDQACDFSGVPDLTLYFTDSLGRNPWLEP